MKGRGTSSVAVGIGAAGIAAITGGTSLILKVKQSQKNDDFDSFEYSGTNYPTEPFIQTLEGSGDDVL